MAEDASLHNVLLDTEQGEEGEEISIQEGDDTEVEPVKVATDP